MKQFAALIEALDRTNKTGEKTDALAEYFAKAAPADCLRAVALLSGRKPKSLVRSSMLRQWAAETAGVDQWLFEESYHVVGDMAETIALLIPHNTRGSHTGLEAFMQQLIALRNADDEEKKQFITQCWREFDYYEKFVFNKLITGGFRIGVAQQLVVRALARVLNMNEAAVSHRLMGNWQPEQTTFEALLLSDSQSDRLSQPYPFCLAHALDVPFDELGPPALWQAEWKWDGIRGQIVRRGNELFVWSRGEELVTDMFPEFKLLLDLLPDGTVADGEIIPWKDNRPLPFHVMQQRNGRKNITAKILKEAPIVFLAYDLLEHEGNDLRQLPLSQRRALLEKLTAAEGIERVFKLSPQLYFETWEEAAALRSNARQELSEGLMLKRHDSVYETGRKRGSWWKWKVDPFTVDAVLIYAQRGHGRRANLYTDYTFAVWDGETLVPFAKAYSGLTDEEIREVDAFVKRNTVDKFGPVRSVKAELVFELAFEGINPSPRHRSGVALRFPRISRWRKDKTAGDADTIATLRTLLKLYADKPVEE
ncbi:MAG: ATP-dependent DNA ligase [Bacteroidia bacterium]|jgi:DNA ligase-1|nr:ATP-dependent DNA ligase [Bacteroidia bacterium]